MTGVDLVVDTTPDDSSSRISTCKTTNTPGIARNKGKKLAGDKRKNETPDHSSSEVNTLYSKQRADCHWAI